MYDFLPKLVGDATMAAVCGEDWRDETKALKATRRFFKPRNSPYMPVEFSAAAFRFGHSQIRETYDLNAEVTRRPIFAAGDAVNPTDDLRGFKPLPLGWKIDWSLFFSLGGQPRQPSRLIDARLSGALFDLPHVNDPHDHAQSLASRNLLRGQSLNLPSGQDVARNGQRSVDRSTARESTRIIAVVILGLLELDAKSFLQVAPLWRPTPDRRSVGELIAFANA